MQIYPINKKRYFSFIEAKGQLVSASLTSWFQQFAPFSNVKTEADTCVIGNGIPKSGTYFINRIINFLGKWENSMVHINSLHWDVLSDSREIVMNFCLPRFAIKKLQNGQFVAAHLPWSKGVEKSIGQEDAQRRIKHVFLYRDPRDTFISYMNFLTYSEKSQKDRKSKEEQAFLLANFASDDERLAYIIEQRRTYKYIKFSPWLNSTHCHSVCFEKLYEDVIRTKEGFLGETLQNLFSYLEIDSNTIDPFLFFDKIYNLGPTASQEENKVGQYKRVFKDEHYALIDNADFRKVLDTFGYEW